MYFTHIFLGNCFGLLEQQNFDLQYLQNQVETFELRHEKHIIWQSLIITPPQLSEALPIREVHRVGFKMMALIMDLGQTM